MANAKILIIKTGLIETLTFPDGSSYESAIRKKPVSMVKVHTLGAEGNDVGLKAHHGGVDKALFFMSDVSFPALNELLGEKFDFHGSAIYGENFVVSGLHEDNVCVGDRYKIGSTLLEVSQPRKPCERLSHKMCIRDRIWCIYNQRFRRCSNGTLLNISMPKYAFPLCT